MTRAVIDPNVLVSAFISQQRASPDRIVRAWREGAFELVVSPQLIAELSDVLGRPKFSRQAADGRAQAYIGAFAGDAILLDDPPDPEPVSQDRDDDYLIALAARRGRRRDRLRRPPHDAAHRPITTGPDATTVRRAARLSPTDPPRMAAATCH